MTALWQLRPQDPDLARRLSDQLHVHPVVAQTLINRGITEAQTAKRFWNPSLSDMTHPFDLPEAEEAADYLAEAVIAGRRIGVYGDYDADGITATAVLINFLRQLGQDPSWYLPNRISQGYGLHSEGLEFMVREGAEVLITADCGTSDFRQLEEARRLGLAVIVTHHHLLGPEPPQALAFVNPQRPDSPAAFNGLAGVGVVFFVLAGLRIKLRERGFFANRPEPNLKQSLGLVALGTLADVAPVVGQNRIILTAGLETLSQGTHPGLAALIQVARIKSPVSPRDVLFGLAPRLNASGRLGQAELGLELLTAADGDQVDALAQELNRLNSRRQRIEQAVLAEAEKALAAQGEPDQKLALVAAGQDWHAGVLGIVASRLSRRYHRPCFVLRIEGETAVGSGRSVEPFHLYQGLERLAPLLLRYGGHSYAAGLTLETKLLDRFAQALEAEVGRSLSQADLVPRVVVDSPLDLDEIDSRLVSDLERLAPFGPGNPEPLFSAEKAGLLANRRVGKNGAHLALTLRQNQKTWPAIAFGLGHLADRLPPTVKIAYRPQYDNFRGKKGLKLHLSDIQPD